MKSPAVEIAIRVFTERPGRKPLASKPRSKKLGPSEWTLVFDCETTTDEAQSLRFGFYQLRKLDPIEEEGVFCEAATLTREEVRLLKAYASSHGLKVISVEQFRRDLLLGYAYKLHATVVGFNLPFDLSRIATVHGSARGHMRGGFTFHLSRSRRDPKARVKHLSPRAALIDFAMPWKQHTPRGMRRRKLRVRGYPGHFVDLKTLGAALLSRRFTLKSEAEALGTPTQKLDTDEHGTMTRRYLDYARTDVQVTWECYQALIGRLAKHDLLTGPDRLLSEASVGKGYLEKMRIKPLLECEPSFPRERFGEMFCAYYGGRAEVRIRRVPCEVIYCDFKSMYPTVNALMGLWRFVIGHGMTVREMTSGTQSLLDGITIEDLQKPATWKKLRTLVRLVPQDDILPVRRKYDEQSFTIGLNYLTAPQPLWYTLADCIVAKLLTGRSPRIDRAVTYLPGPPQEGLTPSKIIGRDDFTIDPTNEDFFTRLVDLRDEARARRDPIERALKIIANSTSYGIFIEVNRDDAPEGEPLSVFGPNGEHRLVYSRAIEDPGRYFNPLLGVLITGAARLMLGIAEKLTLDCGLDWAFCDTDSLAIVRPTGMSRREFHRRAQGVIDWFIPLNPYRKRGSILKIEDLNRAIGSAKMEPLYCYAISAKRYALFNRTRDRIVLRKASAHGLGHLLDPYPESDAPRQIPPPARGLSLKDIGVRRWQYDVWYKIVEAALNGDPDGVRLDWHPAFQRPAAIRYSASSPQLLSWVARWNQGRPYEEQIRPFGFLLAFMPKAGVSAPFAETLVDNPGRGRPPRTETLAPIAPYDSDPARALSKVFDRLTGKLIHPERLKTYAEVLTQYHLSPELKFENGDFRDRGRTERRHVVATVVVWIGKEANQVGESGETDPIWSAVEEFAVTEPVRSRVPARSQRRGTRPPVR
jgi:hypothetical protein